MSSLASDSSETRRLLQQARAGQQEAVDRLLDRHRPYLRSMIELRMDSRMQGRVDPSDVVQEAQLEASRRLAGYLELEQPPMGFRLWLRQIAYDRLLMLRRQHLGAARRTVKRDVSLPDRSSLLLAQQLLANHPTPSQELLRRELRRRVREAVNQLPEGDREVLALRNLEGLSNLETAQVLGIDPATASRRYGRAVLRLREILLQDGVMESEP
jgi:RNA polymerase sigma-70 factor (ECF subfamily)